VPIRWETPKSAMAVPQPGTCFLGAPYTITSTHDRPHQARKQRPVLRSPVSAKRGSVGHGRPSHRTSSGRAARA